MISFVFKECHGLVEKPTSSKSTKGGPAAISAAFVPGRIRSVAPMKTTEGSLASRGAELEGAFMLGDCGPI